MLGLGSVRHPLRTTNTQVGPSVAQRPTPLPNFNSLFVRIKVQPFKPLLMIGIGYGASQRILTAELGMHCVAAKFVHRILTADQKQQRVNVCEEFVRSPLTMQPSCPGLSLVTRAGFAVMTLRHRNNLPNGKVQSHRDRKRRDR
jgi:hypothetical protein